MATHPEIYKTRIYLGGCSNGGYMTLNLMVNYPGSFAAAFPVCEPYANDWLTEEKLSILAEVPMWLTTAKTDGVVPIYEGEWDDDPLYQTLEVGLDNCSVTMLEWDNGAYRLKILNDTTYLK